MFKTGEPVNIFVIPVNMFLERRDWQLNHRYIAEIMIAKND